MLEVRNVSKRYGGGRIVADEAASRLRELMAVPSLEDGFAQLAAPRDFDGVADALWSAITMDARA